jgi:hypothetical protein
MVVVVVVVVGAHQIKVVKWGILSRHAGIIGL